MKNVDFFASLTRRCQERFQSEKRVLTFHQYMDLFGRASWLLGRSSAQYLTDAISHFGTEVIQRPTENETRYLVFDAPFDNGRERLIGQERVQLDFMASLSNFVREGRTGRLVLLHGPNGSAKTSFIRCLARALVAYSRTEQGSIHRFNWVFPKGSYLGKRLGFSSDDPLPRSDSFALADPTEISALIPGEMNDHPILLLPKEDRLELLEQLRSEARFPEAFRFSDYLTDGDLSPISRKIFDALLASYAGDLERVLAHVQVERFHFSRRYRRGIVTVEPQFHVDAARRQLTMEESYSNLPPLLRHFPMYQLSGDLVDANRGLVEFSDLLKRPVDAFKYLLGTCETNRITVDGIILYVDTVLVGTSNDLHLHAFTQSPDFPSFKGRIDLVRVPYLRDFRVEAGIYDMQVTSEKVGRHVAPHASLVAALWGVLTRLRKPTPDHYPESLKSAVSALRPLQKAVLYAEGIPPVGLRADVAAELVQNIGTMFREYERHPDYEGSVGASPRELKTALLNAAQSQEVACLHPVKVFSELEALTRLKSVYAFLRLQPSGEYHDAQALLERTQDWYADQVTSEFQASMGLVGDDEFKRLLGRYAENAKAHIKKETIVDPNTRERVPADERFMRDMESRWNLTEDREKVRQDVLGRIASYSLDSPGLEFDYRLLFPKEFEKLKTAYFKEHEQDIRRSCQSVLEFLDGVPLSEAAGQDASGIVATMKQRFGYCDQCIGPALSFLLTRWKSA